MTIYSKLKFDTGLTKLACKVADLLAFLIPQVLQVPIPASCLHHHHHQWDIWLEVSEQNSTLAQWMKGWGKRPMGYLVNNKKLPTHTIFPGQYYKKLFQDLSRHLLLLAQYVWILPWVFGRWVATNIRARRVPRHLSPWSTYLHNPWFYLPEPLREDPRKDSWACIKTTLLSMKVWQDPIGVTKKKVLLQKGRLEEGGNMNILLKNSYPSVYQYPKGWGHPRYYLVHGILSGEGSQDEEAPSLPDSLEQLSILFSWGSVKEPGCLLAQQREPVDLGSHEEGIGHIAEERDLEWHLEQA